VPGGGSENGHAVNHRHPSNPTFPVVLPKGIDHVLFVLGIFLLSVRIRPILIQATTFTLTHSITLGLTMYGILSLPLRVVEPLIALSPRSPSRSLACTGRSPG